MIEPLEVVDGEEDGPSECKHAKGVNECGGNRARRRGCPARIFAQQRDGKRTTLRGREPRRHSVENAIEEVAERCKG